MIEWSPTLLGRTICFTQFINSNVNLIQKQPYRHTKNNVQQNVWVLHGTNWHIKLTILGYHRREIKADPLINATDRIFWSYLPLYAGRGKFQKLVLWKSLHFCSFTPPLLDKTVERNQEVEDAVWLESGPPAIDLWKDTHLWIMK